MPLPFRDLREFMEALRARGELRRVEAPVNPVLEVAAITDRVQKAGGPALFFTNVQGSPWPVLTNALGSEERVKLALGIEDWAQVDEAFSSLLEGAGGASAWEKLKLLPRLGKLAGSLHPRLTRQAPCQEVVEEEHPSLAELPVLQCWPGDAGRFITLPQVYTVDPDTGRRNLGMYRLQVFDERTTGMHWHAHKDAARLYRRYGELGRRMPVAVALGGDPALTYAATAPLPPGVDELWLVGLLRGEPVEMVRCRTVDLLVPAGAEFVLEGYVEPGEWRPEGPFGDHTGFYSPREDFPVFHLTCLTRRRDPIYPATVVGPPPAEDAALGLATERLFLPLIKLQLPEVVDMHLPAAGGFHNCAIVSIRKEFPGHARRVMHALWGMGQMMLTKFIIVVDAHVDVHDPQEVAWRVFHNVDPERDLEPARGPLDALDHSSPTALYGAKLGIDATAKLLAEGHPRPWPGEARMSEEIEEMVARRWAEYGLADLRGKER